MMLRTNFSFSVLLVLFLVLIANFSQAQVSFQNTYSHSPYIDNSIDVVDAGNGTYVICGFSNNSQFQSDIGLAWIDSLGQLLKYRTYGSFSNEMSTGIIRTVDGLAVTGQTNDSIGSQNTFIMKTDFNGDTSWIKIFGSVFSSERSQDMIQTADGGFAITGHLGFGGSSDYSAFLLKTDGNGNLNWVREFRDTVHSVGYSLVETFDHGIVLCGNRDGISNRIFLTKTDSAGNVLWAKHFNQSTNFAGTDVIQTSDSGFAITGSISGTGAGANDYLLIKTDATGNLLWSKTYGGAMDEVGKKVVQTADDGFIISGTTASFGNGLWDVYLVKADAAGNLKWSKTYGGPDNDLANSLIQTNDGGYVLNGLTDGFGASNFDIYVVKTDSLGSSGCNETNPPTQMGTPAIADSQAQFTLLSSVNTYQQPFHFDSGGQMTTLCSTGTEEGSESSDQVSVFPNPASDYFTLQSNSFSGKTVHVKILNAIGACVYLDKSAFNQTINCKELSAGIYYIVIESHGGTIPLKLIKN